jgi:hypothetical protein
MRASAIGKFGADIGKNEGRPHRIIAMRSNGGVACVPSQYQFSPEAARSNCTEIESLAFWSVCVVSRA